jgi:hypothetical protein
VLVLRRAGADVRVGFRAEEREVADPDERVLDRGRVGVRVATSAG